MMELRDDLEGPESKRFRRAACEEPPPPCSFRKADPRTFVVNFGNIGKSRGDFDWNNVRKCVLHLHERNFDVVGVVFENFWGQDSEGRPSTMLPQDIHDLCKAVLFTPRIHNSGYEDVEEEMTLKCAYARNCRYLGLVEAKFYNRWRHLRKPGMASWLWHYRDLLHVRYFFEDGHFHLIEGNMSWSNLEGRIFLQACRDSR